MKCKKHSEAGKHGADGELYIVCTDCGATLRLAEERSTDICRCGDRRDQHDAQGCKLNGLGHGGPGPCDQFRFAWREPSKPVMLCSCGKVLENPAAYAAHCAEAPTHFNQS